VGRVNGSGEFVSGEVRLSPREGRASPCPGESGGKPRALQVGCVLRKVFEGKRIKGQTFFNDWSILDLLGDAGFSGVG
jgi:hypothetical protein